MAVENSFHVKLMVTQSSDRKSMLPALTKYIYLDSRLKTKPKKKSKKTNFLTWITSDKIIHFRRWLPFFGNDFFKFSWIKNPKLVFEKIVNKHHQTERTHVKVLVALWLLLSKHLSKLNWSEVETWRIWRHTLHNYNTNRTWWVSSSL